jgi:Flp pilus assembly protein TadG
MICRSPGSTGRDRRESRQALGLSRRRRERHDGGTLTVELVLLTPLLLAFLMFVVGLGRLAETRGLVDGAARDAARAASLTRTPDAAVVAAEHAATVDLAGAGLHCASVRVSTDTSRFQPGGQVRVTVACTADLKALTGIGLPTSKTLSAASTAPLETYRGITP